MRKENTTEIFHNFSDIIQKTKLCNTKPLPLIKSFISINDDDATAIP